MLSQGQVKLVGVYCDDCGELGCEGGDVCGEAQVCCVDSDGKTKHNIVRYEAAGLCYRMCSKCGDLDPGTLNEMSCCVVKGMVCHKYLGVKNKNLDIEVGTVRDAATLKSCSELGGGVLCV